MRRDIQPRTLTGDIGLSIIEAATQGKADLLVLLMDREDLPLRTGAKNPWAEYMIRHATCLVFLAVPPPIPALTDGQ